MYIYWQIYFHLKNKLQYNAIVYVRLFVSFLLLTKTVFFKIQLYQHKINKVCKSKRYPMDTFSTRSCSCTDPEDFLRRVGLGGVQRLFEFSRGPRHILVILQCNLEKYEFCRRALNPSFHDPRMLPFCFIFVGLIIRVSLDSCW